MLKHCPSLRMDRGEGRSLTHTEEVEVGEKMRIGNLKQQFNLQSRIKALTPYNMFVKSQAVTNTNISNSASKSDSTRKSVPEDEQAKGFKLELHLLEVG